MSEPRGPGAAPAASAAASGHEQVAEATAAAETAAAAEPQERASGAGAPAGSRKRWRAPPLVSGPAKPSDAPAPRAGAEEENKTNWDQLSEDLEEL